MSDSAGADLASAAAAFDAAADDLELELQRELDDELEELLDAAAALARDWESATRELGVGTDAARADMRSTVDGIETRAAAIAAELDVVLEQFAEVELAVDHMKAGFEKARGDVPSALDALAERVHEVTLASERLSAPVAKLNGEAVSALGSHQERVASGLGALITELSEECASPTASKAEDFSAGMKTSVAFVGGVFDRNREHLGAEIARLLSATDSRARDELRALGGDTIDVLTKLAAAVQDVAECVRAVAELKELLVDGMTLTNSGAQLVVDLFEELHQLLSDT